MKRSAIWKYPLGVLAVLAAIMPRAVRGDFETVASEDAVALGGATGGDIVRKITNSDGSYDFIHIFTNTASTATFSVPSQNTILDETVRFLVVGGGGGGGGDCGAGGGGGGVVISNDMSIASGDYTITVGAGGAQVTNTRAARGNDGSASTIVLGGTTLYQALGGGGGGTHQGSLYSGNDGGSGGGAGRTSSDVGSGLQPSNTISPGYGNAGGIATASTGSNYHGGGGGGAGAAGGAATSSCGGDGGDGIYCDITGDEDEDYTYFGGGGGGGGNNTSLATEGTGGKGGGGAGVGQGTGHSNIGEAGTAGTGGGGGGGCGGTANARGGAGGSGIVVVRYTVGGVNASVSPSIVTGTTDTKYYRFTEDGTFYVSGMVKARVLAVGGGGSGAAPGSTGSGYGGAGGGGAGGMVDNDSIYFGSGTYNIVIGQGGTLTSAATTAARGANGGDTYILYSGDNGSTNYVMALGGGGGGIASSTTLYKGLDGGSGGGGSWRSATLYEGGSATQPDSVWGGYGYAGGNGVNKAVGAGGGGAGGAGGDSDVELTGGAGGAGRSSDITGDEEWFAGGGGGGTWSNNKTTVYTGGAGGSDIGGTGAGGTSASPIAATAGKDGTGSGGGGGRYRSLGAAGGSGIVIIRIEELAFNPLAKPGVETNLSDNARWLGSYTYTGEEISPYGEEFDEIFQEYEGDFAATAVKDGLYSFTLRLKTGLRWSDGTDDELTCYWEIEKEALSITKFAVAGWQQGEVPTSSVTLKSTPTLTYGSDYTCQYATSGGAVWTDWTPGQTLDTGDYQMRLVLAESSSYDVPDGWKAYRTVDGVQWYIAESSSDATGYTSFSVWDYTTDYDFPSALGYHSVITVTDTPAQTLTNFPMLVRIDETTHPGIYRYAASDCSDIRFTMPYDADTALPFEIDEWDTSGESLIWVKVPEYYNGAEVVMSWGQTATTNAAGSYVASTLPSLSSDTVWSDYAGVWHMGDTTDSTGNADWSEIGRTAYTTNGLMGLAIDSDGSNGPHMTAERSDVMDALTNGTFRAGFWLNLNDNTQTNWPALFGRRWGEDPSAVGWGGRLGSEGSATATMGGSSNYVTTYCGEVSSISNIAQGSISYATIPSTDTWTITIPAGDDVATGDTVRLDSIVLGMYSSNDAGSNAERYVKITTATGDVTSDILNGTGSIATSTKFSDGTFQQTFTFSEGCFLTVGTSYSLAFIDASGNAAQVRLGMRSTTDAAYSPIVQSTTVTSYRICQQVNFHKPMMADLGDGAISAGEWVRLDFVMGGDVLEWWVNGEKAAEITGETVYTVNDTEYDRNFAIGGFLGRDDNVGGVNGMIDEFRLTATHLDAAWIAAEYAQAGEVCTSRMYTDRNTTFYNTWLTEPSVSSTAITVGGEIDVSIGEGVYGGTNVTWYIATEDGSITYGQTTDGLSAGTYAIVFVISAGEDEDGTRKWTGTTTQITITVSQQLPVYKLGDAAAVTRLGRILLANDDDNSTALSAYRQPVSGQAYYYTTNNVTGDDATYWVHEDEVTTTFSRLQSPTTHYLMSKSAVEELCGSQEIWYMTGVRIGNLIGTLNNALYYSPEVNYLPQSTTAGPMTSGGTTGSYAESANLVMRNEVGAAIYSPCYTNGIGTIYFDAVNSGTNHVSESTGEAYKFVVEIAKAASDGTLPTDDNCYEEVSSTDDDGETTTSRSVIWDDWEQVTMTAIKIVNGVAASTTQTTELALDIETGGGSNSFYRVVVEHDAIGTREPVRFRIRRTSIPPTIALDAGGFILIDNIEVSPPPVRVDLQPLGNFDSEKGGAQVTGWSGAFEPAFPEAGGTAYSRMDAVFSLNSLTNNSSIAVNGGTNYIVSATMYYRWRYLGITNDWQTVGLVRDNGFRSASALDIPDDDGDIEFWTVLEQAAPYYKYCDYSGLSLDLAGYGYTEEVTTITNKCDDADTVKAKTLGSDWFVRLRDGASDWEKFGISFLDGEGSNAVVTTYWATLADDNTWRYYLKTPQSLAGSTLKFRLEGWNSQTSGSRDWATNATYYAIDASSSTSEDAEGVLNASFSEREEFPDDETGDWCEIEIDSATGYLLFQMEEAAKSITVVHADYQNFDDWSDAVGSKFLGAFVSTNNVEKPASGVSPDKQTFYSDFDTWNSMPKDSGSDPDYWSESFTTATGVSTNYFTTATLTFNGWTATQGKYVYEKFNSTTDTEKYALQMRGNALGSISYSGSGSLQPRGIETLSFSTRLSNSLEWDDICYWDTDDTYDLGGYTFTAGVKAYTNDTVSLQGAVSVSMIANYRPRKGCYEFRYQQLDSTYGQIELWKWAKSKDGKSMVSYYLGGGKWSGLGSATRILMNTDRDSYYASMRYATMSIAVTNLSSSVTKVYGILKATSPYDYGFGEAGKTDSSYVVEFTDDGTVGGSALQKGTVGVSSANCPAIFHYPRYYKSAVTTTDTSYGTKEGDYKDGFQVHKSAINMTFPSSYYSTVDNQVGGTDGYMVDYDDWDLALGRMYGASIGSGTSSRNVLCAAAGSTTLGIFLANGGTTAFSGDSADAITNVTVSSFSSEAHTLPLYVTEDCSVQIRLVEDDNPAEVVIDDISLTQFRGADWEDLDSDIITHKPTSGRERYAYTNFTFTSCWTTNSAVLMSARRTSTNSLCTIVTPLMDGYSYGSPAVYTAGVGLGQISFNYTGAQTNAEVTVEYLAFSTNVWQSDIYEYAWEENSAWTVATNFVFDATSGKKSCYIGLHGVHGLIRLRVPQELVEQLAEDEVSDATAFGEVTISNIICTDEPDLDMSAWWGWNVRTGGDEEDGENRMLIGDISKEKTGLFLALNNSVTADIASSSGDADYKVHMPFLQSPTFGTNLVGGVTFKARKYAYTTDEDPNAATLNSYSAYVSLYGSLTGDENGEWVWLRDFEVTTNRYQNFSYTTSSSDLYMAFRLIVRAVDGVSEQSSYTTDENGYSVSHMPSGGMSPVRVLIEEAAVTEAIRPRVGFRFVGAFRSDMNGTDVVTNVPSASEQPLCNEGWGVQCEIYKAQMPDKIDFTGVDPTVNLYYYVGTNVWGYSNWKNEDDAKGPIALMRVAAAEGASETNYVFRSSYNDGQGGATVLPLSSTPGTVVQYMLEVVYNRYNDKGDSLLATNLLTSSDWSTPEWYRPVDYNALTNSFSAYTILDTVAPYWAWINEINILGKWSGYSNTDKDCQFVEIACPAGVDLTGWYLQFLEAKSTYVITNVAAVFGQGDLSGTKSAYNNAQYGLSFRVIGSPASYTSGRLSYSNGTLDGTWSFATNSYIYSMSTGVIAADETIAVQLVRPSGILESEITAIGENDPSWGDDYHATNVTARLNSMSGSHLLYAGSDDNWENDVYSNSVSVVTNTGGSYACWTNDTYSCWTNGVKMTPGRINIGQVVEGEVPNPGGWMRLIFPSISGARIYQFDPEGESETEGETGAWTTDDLTFYVQRNVGTNIYYRVEPWHRVNSATWTVTGSGVTNTVNAYKVTGTVNDWYINVGTNVEGNISVVASAAPRSDVENLIGSDNKYREGILDWLANSYNYYGQEWEDSDQLYLAEFRNLGLQKQSDLSLTEMYWLDIPPTTSNMWLVGGMEWPSQLTTNRYDSVEDEWLTNTLVIAKLYITNANENSDWTIDGAGTRGWSPYIIQGMDPGGTSLKYLEDGRRWSWTNATFKIRGKLPEFLSYTDDYWVTFRRFIFNESSFDENHEALIELLDWHSSSSPGYVWLEWIESHGSSPFFMWSLDDNYDFYGIETLSPTNLYK